MRAAHLLSREFVRSHPGDAAPVLERLPIGETTALLEDLPATTAAAGLHSMVATTGADCLARMTDLRSAAILDELPPEVAAGLLIRLADAHRERLLAAMPPKNADALRRRLSFRKGTAGSLVDPQAVSFPEQTTAGQALSRLRQSPRRESFYVYIVDREDRLLGVVTLHQLVLAPSKSSLASIMNPRFGRLPATADHDTIVAHPGWSDAHALPVVDDTGRFLGVIDHETMRRLQGPAAEPARRHQPASLGMVFADVCWIGMTRIVGGVALATFRSPVSSAAATREPNDG